MNSPRSNDAKEGSHMKILKKNVPSKPFGGLTQLYSDVL
jgi:hypothetical protein